MRTIVRVSVMILLLSMLGCTSLQRLPGTNRATDARAMAIAEAVRTQIVGDSDMDTACGAYGVIEAALSGGSSENLESVEWSAWTDDPDERAWMVKCDATYTVLMPTGTKSVTTQIFLLMVDYQEWELRYIPGRTDEMELLGVWGMTLPVNLTAPKPE